MKPGVGPWVVRVLVLVLAFVAWQTGVLFPALFYFAGCVSGVAATWVVARLRLED